MAAMSDATGLWAPRSPDRTGFLERKGALIYYEDAGEGPAIIFAHGLGGNHLSWWQQVPHFRARFRCVTFAHRGFLPSTCEAGVPDPLDYAGDVAALADHLGLGTFAYVGQSMGGWGGVELALSHPGRLEALVLAATSGTLDPRQANPAGYADWRAKSDATVELLRARAVHPAVGATLAAANPAFHHLYRAIDALSHGLDKNALRARLMATRKRPLADAAGIKVRTLFVTGSEDVVFPSCCAAALAAACADARHEQIAGAGHSAYFDKPAEFNATVQRFLRG
ncbi:MAG: alpha/beta fold hydrolase [Alphaproteobacteria bacterium]|nr:alpha/beta fold hydrolase [Alphaproteobacteria bacterium]